MLLFVHLPSWTTVGSGLACMYAWPTETLFEKVVTHTQSLPLYSSFIFIITNHPQLNSISIGEWIILQMHFGSDAWSTPLLKWIHNYCYSISLKRWVMIIATTQFVDYPLYWTLLYDGNECWRGKYIIKFFIFWDIYNYWQPRQQHQQNEGEHPKDDGPAEPKNQPQPLVSIEL